MVSSWKMSFALDKMLFGAALVDSKLDDVEREDVSCLTTIT